MSGGRPVARLLQPVIARVSVMAALMAAIAVTGVVLSTTAVNYLTARAAAGRRRQPAGLPGPHRHVRGRQRVVRAPAWRPPPTTTSRRCSGCRPTSRWFASSPQATTSSRCWWSARSAPRERWIEGYAQPRMDADPSDPEQAATAAAGPGRHASRSTRSAAPTRPPPRRSTAGSARRAPTRRSASRARSSRSCCWRSPPGTSSPSPGASSSPSSPSRCSPSSRWSSGWPRGSTTSAPT